MTAGTGHDSDQPQLTDARRRGLEAVANQHPNLARVSNITQLELGHVYWQTAQWLEDHGFCRVRYFVGAGNCISLTDAGVELARAEGLLLCAS